MSFVFKLKTLPNIRLTVD